MQARSGYDVMFVSGGGTFVDLLEREGVRHVTLVQETRRPQTVIRTISSFVRLCRRFRPHVVHAHMMGSAVIGFAASRICRAALVTTVHNSFDVHSFLMRLGDRIVAVSQNERDRLVERGYASEKVRTIWNAPFATPRLPAVIDVPIQTFPRPCVTAICGLHRRKGVFDIIEACAGAFRNFPDWSLNIVGEGPDRRQLEAQAQALGIQNRVRFLGFSHDPRYMFQNTDIFVLASYADPGSLSIGEARVAGCPIVATAVGGTSEMLAFGRAGRLVPPGDPSRLERELTDLMADPTKRAALSLAALDGAEIFDVHRLVPEYEAVYRDAMLARAIAND